MWKVNVPRLRNLADRNIRASNPGYSPSFRIKFAQLANELGILRCPPLSYPRISASIRGNFSAIW